MQPLRDMGQWPAFGVRQRGKPIPPTRSRDPIMPAYEARISHSDRTVRIYRQDGRAGPRRVVDAMHLPVGADLRTALADNGWRPTGQLGRAGGHGAVWVEPVDRAQTRR